MVLYQFYKGSSRFQEYPFFLHTYGVSYHQKVCDYTHGVTVGHLFHCRSGHGIFSVNGQIKRVTAGDVFYFKAGASVSYRPADETPWMVDYVSFRGEGCRWLFERYGVPIGTVLRDPPLIAALDRLLEAVEQKEGDLAVASELYQLLVQLGLYFYGKKKRAGFNDALRLLRESYDRDLPIGQIAAAGNLSESAFYKQFRQLYDGTPVAYRLMCRVEAAKEYLLNTTQTVEAIGRKVGFHSTTYFIEVFRRQEGVTPGRYRALRRFP